MELNRKDGQPAQSLEPVRLPPLAAVLERPATMTSPTHGNGEHGLADHHQPSMEQALKGFLPNRAKLTNRTDLSLTSPDTPHFREQAWDLQRQGHASTAVMPPLKARGSYAPGAQQPEPCGPVRADAARRDVPWSAPSPALSPPKPQHAVEGHTLLVRQQPVAARACGAGDGDRRAVDPPPILELRIDIPGLPEDEKIRRLRNPYFVINCYIFSKDGTRDCSLMNESYSQHRRMIGNTAGSPFVGRDEHGQLGCFFPFPDLSIRSVGEFRLKFNMVLLEPTALTKPGKSYPVSCSVMSDIVTVYSAKDFPGMTPSTPLVRRLKQQGCEINIKKGKQRRGRDLNVPGASDEDNEDAGTASSRKRTRVQ